MGGLVLNQRAIRFDIADPCIRDTCVMCGEDGKGDNIGHLLLSCPAVSEHRKQLLQPAINWLNDRNLGTLAVENKWPVLAGGHIGGIRLPMWGGVPGKNTPKWGYERMAEFLAEVIPLLMKKFANSRVRTTHPQAAGSGTGSGGSL
ncbi:hypothetical protein O6H91_19G066600 [Diphasiastrum complanatum]|uniref:Uncharacterized protein n=1 Tax=Diphasiastrum complanatum TaxID=34168 RepID=A0ACC2AW47_DIPCM|nr:hypothetical protein O6H91_19G066600 [Diphasiastrum complanatum]